MHTAYRLVLFDTDPPHVALCVVEYAGAVPVAWRPIDTSGYVSGDALLSEMAKALTEAHEHETLLAAQVRSERTAEGLHV